MILRAEFTDKQIPAALNLEKFWSIDHAHRSASPILGKDRDGRDVRKGDRVRCGCDRSRPDGKCLVNLPTYHHEPAGAPITSASGRNLNFQDGYCIDPKHAILVTDAPQAAQPKAPLPIVTDPARTETLIHKLCPACGERQPGAECQAPACKQIRKHVAERKLDERGRRVADLDEGTDIMPDCAELRSLTGYDAVDLYGDGAPPWASVPLRDVLAAVLVVSGKPIALRISRREVAAAGGELGPSMPTRRRNAEALRSVIIRKAKAMGAGR